MKIVVDGRMLTWTGIGRYTLSLLDGLQAIDQTNEYTVLMRRADWGKWAPRAGNFHRVECDIEPYSLAEQLKLPRLLKRLRADVVHFVTPNAAVLYAGRKVVTVHDLTLLDYDTSRGSLPRRLVTKLKRIPFRLAFLRQIATATHILTDTEHVKQQLANRFGIDHARITSIWLAADANHLAAEQEQQVQVASTWGTCLLYVGNYYPYKNVKTVIEAVGLLAQDHPELKLLLVGNANEFKAELMELARALGVSDRVIMTGYVTDGQLRWLYRNCKLYINPSLSEGFGLQGLEAMSQGLPVVAARASCLPEVYGDAALYFDPLSARDLSRQITGLLADPSRLSGLAAKGRERVGMFSWRKTAEATYQQYLDVSKDAA